MPLYEYHCADCNITFEALRPMKEADAPIACEHCASEHTGRTLSLFVAVSGGKTTASGKTITAEAGGGCACGGQCGCGHSHSHN